MSSDFQTKYYVILAFCRHVRLGFAQAPRRPARPGLAGDPRGRAGGEHDGRPADATKLWAYAVGAVAGGVGGAFYATIVGTVNVDSFNFQFSIIMLCAVVLGGMGNVWGAILGAVVITWFNYTGLTWIGDKFGDINLEASTSSRFFGLILVLMMLFRREGFIPAARTEAGQDRPTRQNACQHRRWQS